MDRSSVHINSNMERVTTAQNNVDSLRRLANDAYKRHSEEQTPDNWAKYERLFDQLQLARADLRSARLLAGLPET